MPLGGILLGLLLNVCLATLNCGRIRFGHSLVWSGWCYLWYFRSEKRTHFSFMDTKSANTVSEVKPWVRRVVAAAGERIELGEKERRLGWWGVEMSRFLSFCRALPAGTELLDAMKGCGQFLKTSVPSVPEWRLEQAREALR